VFRVGPLEGFGQEGFGCRVPLEFECMEYSVPFFDIIDLLLILGSPEIAVRENAVVSWNLRNEPQITDYSHFGSHSEICPHSNPWLGN
jgi:hypothetical protein